MKWGRVKWLELNDKAHRICHETLQGNKWEREYERWRTGRQIESSEAERIRLGRISKSRQRRKSVSGERNRKEIHRKVEPNTEQERT